MAYNLGTIVPQTYKLGTQQVVQLRQGLNQVWPETAQPLDGFLLIGDPEGNITTLSALNAYLFSTVGFPAETWVKTFSRDASGNITASLGNTVDGDFPPPSSITVTDNPMNITYFKDYTGKLQSVRFGSGLATSEKYLQEVHLKTGSFVNNAYVFCQSIKRISADYITGVAYGAFSSLNCPTSASITIDLTAIPRDGLSLGNGYPPTTYPSPVVYNNVFQNISYNGELIIPLEYETNNSGNPDGDIGYLTTSPRNWTITYAYK